MNYCEKIEDEFQCRAYISAKPPFQHECDYFKKSSCPNQSCVYTAHDWTDVYCHNEEAQTSACVDIALEEI